MIVIQWLFDEVFALKLIDKEMSLKLSPVFFLSLKWCTLVHEDIKLGLNSSIDDWINMYPPYLRE